MTSILSVYYSAWHWWAETEEYFRQLDPAWGRIHQPSGRGIFTFQSNARNANVMLRSWDIDDDNANRKREMYENPKKAALLHLNMWGGKLEQWRQEMRQNGWAVDESKWYLGLVNEPDPNMLPQVVEYGLEAMRIAGDRGWRLGLGCSSVGTFKLPHEEDPNMNLLRVWEDPINAGGHIYIAHEYWEPKGPNHGEDGGYLAWRHKWLPLNVPILIGEAGANGYIENRYTSHDDGGWGNYMDANTYAAQVANYIENCDKRVQGVCLYMTDYHSDQWRTFDTHSAHEALLKIKHVKPQKPNPFGKTEPKPKPVEIKLPFVSSGPTIQEEAKPMNLVHPVQDPNQRRISQIFGVNEHYYKKFNVDGVALKGHNGIDFACVPGSLIQAVDTGSVVEVASDPGGYGLYVKLVHSWGESLYAHLQDQQAIIGETANKGEIIGRSGWTGNVIPPGPLGAHLHFGLRVNPYNRQDGWGGYANPLPFLPTADVQGNRISVTEIRKLIAQVAAEYGRDVNQVTAQVMAESSFNNLAVSSKGAKGLMQLMPLTWDEWSAKVGATDIWNPLDNLRVGCAYMNWLEKQLAYYGNQATYVALISYGWGIGNMLAQKEEPPQVWKSYASNILFGANLLKALHS